MRRFGNTEEGFFSGTRFRDSVFGWSIIFGPILISAILLKLFYKPEPIEPHYVFGCYVAESAPALNITREAILVDQPNRPSFSYSVKAAKQGYYLDVSPAMALTPAGDGHYVFQPALNQTYWPLLPPGYEQPARLRHLSDYRGRLNVYSRDGARFIYSRINSSKACF